MNFNRHSDLVGRHAFLSPSKYHWVNYDDEKFDQVFLTSMTAQKGVELHAFAAEAIRLGIKLPRNNKTLNMYVNDAIGYRMSPEQILYYSENCYGTCDALSFRKGYLRVHDLKNGVTVASVTQLEIYGALFCLEYDVKPAEIEIEMRIYQNDEIRAYMADPNDITHVMDKIITFDKRIKFLKLEARS